jgi:hypothetical protein
MAGNDRAVRLGQAPRAFLPDLWKTYRAGYASDDDALGNLDNELAGSMEFIRQKRSEMGLIPAEDTAQQRVRYEIGIAIVAELKARLGDGRLIATGLQPPGLEQVTLPMRKWPDCSMNFIKDTIVDEPFRFIEVRIARPAGAQAVEECAEWLQGQSGVKKQQRFDEARRRFPGITSREFNTAYARVFGRRPGRPRKSAPENST